MNAPEHRPEFQIEPAVDSAARAAYYALRTKVFVHRQGLFTGHDRDERDEDSRTVVLVARDGAGTVLGGVRLGPVDAGPDLGWWSGGRLVADPDCRVRGVGGALVRAACAYAESAGVLRFEATVQARNEVFFRRLGWTSLRPVTVFDAPHVLMRWPIDRIAALAAATGSACPPRCSTTPSRRPDATFGYWRDAIASTPQQSRKRSPPRGENSTEIAAGRGRSSPAGSASSHPRAPAVCGGTQRTSTPTG